MVLDQLVGCQGSPELSAAAPACFGASFMITLSASSQLHNSSGREGVGKLKDGLEDLFRHILKRCLFQ